MSDDYIPTRYGDCLCECHQYPGVSHIAPCCYPDDKPIFRPPADEREGGE